MTEKDSHAIRMETEPADGTVGITLIGNASHRVTVEYELEVSGSSRTRHHGKSTLAAGERGVLSRVMLSTGDGNWCARLEVRQSDGVTYQERAGPCA
ncbi:curli-like amyloid fiber formation chaperone CsgH [Novosphingopyxis sp. YJ-S2-01]|uniref:curli-like amyloid fiber formation chaperone CsgH n=1 Tax=Novosphingopyxis sp. YJ-S2-01 TaxID=2794021 RepID=UPI0018DB6BAF|nr:curli-like amyloid fiber formation chaperone CsgH [Novosphingopyxis sp. YJ-S2-01]MBH9536709.1 hypothetical protein [Novosphingopyxis sp. YJ-S2-01]